MKKNITPKSREKKQSKTLSTGIIVAIIAFLGTLITALFGYFGLRYQADQSIKITETTQTIPQLETNLHWAGCFLKTTVLPDNISPEQNSYSTLFQFPDFDNWAVAPMSHVFGFGDDNDLVIPVSAEISLRNTSTDNGKWIKVNNKIDTRLDLVSPDVKSHINLVYFKGGCGGDDYKHFTPITLNHDTSLLNQVATSIDYGFFQYQPGEYDDFIIDFVCNAPGIYQASVTLKVDSSGVSEEKKLTGLGKIVCPKSYTLWITPLALSSTEPLEYVGEYYWDGKSYVEKP